MTAPCRQLTSPTTSWAAVTAATPQTEALYAIADKPGWLVGETLEHALAALQRDLAG
jgi:hypothetical protein